jgi:SAM-dependent methyltransferase
MTDCTDKIYRNAGNLALLQLIPSHTRVLDCGCGAGDNARLLQARGSRVVGITISPDEQASASAYCERAYLADLEQGLPQEIGGGFDIILLSHVLEHLRHPERVLQDARRLLAPDGMLAVALPNVLAYSNRCKFLAGSFEYTSGGVMDETHVRFYTFASGKRLLVENGYTVVTALAEGAFPLWKVRNILPARSVQWINRWACQHWPGLFGAQSLYLARSKT